MLDQPNAAALLKAMAKTLTEDVLPKTSGPTRHSVRVVANLCHILEREFAEGQAAGERTREDLQELLDQDGSLSDLVEEFDRRLRGAVPDQEGGDPEVDEDFECAARKVLMKDVKRRLAIDRPGYDS